MKIHKIPLILCSMFCTLTFSSCDSGGDSSPTEVSESFVPDALIARELELNVVTTPVGCTFNATTFIFGSDEVTDGDFFTYLLNEVTYSRAGDNANLTLEFVTGGSFVFGFNFTTSTSGTFFLIDTLNECDGNIIGTFTLTLPEPGE